MESRFPWNSTNSWGMELAEISRCKRKMLHPSSEFFAVLFGLIQKARLAKFAVCIASVNNPNCKHHSLHRQYLDDVTHSCLPLSFSPSPLLLLLTAHEASKFEPFHSPLRRPTDRPQDLTFPAVFLLTVGQFDGSSVSETPPVEQNSHAVK